VTDSTKGTPQLGERLNGSTVLGAKSRGRDVAAECKNAGRAAIEFHGARLLMGAHEHMLAHAMIDSAAHNEGSGFRGKSLP
jgi:hypothetical protein